VKGTVARELANRSVWGAGRSGQYRFGFRSVECAMPVSRALIMFSTVRKGVSPFGRNGIPRRLIRRIVLMSFETLRQKRLHLGNAQDKVKLSVFFVLPPYGVGCMN